MNKCLRITLLMEPSEDFMKDVIQQSARKYNLEGFCQPIFDKDKGVKVIVCGEKENVDSFVDILHKEQALKDNIKDIEIEPFIKDRDYRGVFRIIE